MEKIPFNISASAQDQTALIRITGTIGWSTDSELFRARIDAIREQGVKKAHLYLNGPGGSVFDAEEIVNILKDAFPEKITGEGGALVASAYTRIAMICETFEQPKNGSFMVHKPKGGAYGTANDLRSYLKLLEDKEQQYLTIYKAKTTDQAEFTKQWEAGDWWMTASEAKKNGFITSVKKEEAKIDAATTALILACGCPDSKIPIINNIKNESEMDLKLMAKSLGLPETATEEEITAAIEAGRKAQRELTDLQEENRKKAGQEKAAKIKAALDEAIGDKRITADQRENWQTMLDANFETACASLKALSPVKKVNVVPSGKSEGKTTYKGKTFDQLQDEDPEALAELEKNDPEAFLELFQASVKGK